jgi:hypothetical protein
MKFMSDLNASAIVPSSVYDVGGFVAVRKQTRNMFYHFRLRVFLEVIDLFDDRTRFHAVP